MHARGLARLVLHASFGGQPLGEAQIRNVHDASRTSSRGVARPEPATHAGVHRHSMNPLGSSLTAAVSIALLLVASPRSAASQGGSPPSVEFVTAPAPGATVHYAVQFAWQGTDADGLVQSYRIAIDPPAFGEPAWLETTNTSQLFFFATTLLQSPVPASGPVTFTQPHTLVIEAVDNDGLESEPLSRSFITSNLAPEVQIVSPTPNPSGPVPIGSDLIIGWQGTDSDGVFTHSPIRYRYTLLTGSVVDGAWSNPAAFRDQYAPDFASWSPAASDSPSVHFSNLVPGGRYLFCVVGFDEAGAYSARFAPGTNMIQLLVGVTPTIPKSWGALKARYR